MMIVSNIPTKLEIMYKMHNILYDKKKKKKNNGAKWTKNHFLVQ